MKILGVYLQADLKCTSVARGGGGGVGGAGGAIAPPPPPNNAISEFCWYIWKFVGTCKADKHSFVPTKYLKYQQNIERNGSFKCENAKIF